MIFPYFWSFQTDCIVKWASQKDLHSVQRKRQCFQDSQDSNLHKASAEDRSSPQRQQLRYLLCQGRTCWAVLLAWRQGESLQEHPRRSSGCQGKQEQTCEKSSVYCFPTNAHSHCSIQLCHSVSDKLFQRSCACSATLMVQGTAVPVS